MVYQETSFYKLGGLASYTRGDWMDIRNRLIQFDVVKDDTFTKAFLNFGSPFIRDGITRLSNNLARDSQVSTESF